MGDEYGGRTGEKDELQIPDRVAEDLELIGFVKGYEVAADER